MKKLFNKKIDKVIDKVHDEYSGMLDTILSHYGKNHQIVKCIEELGELQCALARYINDDLRFTTDELMDNVREEIADVCFMLDQMTYAFGYDEVKSIQADKIMRTMDKIILENDKKLKGDL